MANLREQCQALLAIPDPVAKAQARGRAGPVRPAGLPNKPFPNLPACRAAAARPQLLPHTQIKHGTSDDAAKAMRRWCTPSCTSRRNAIDLALDICWRFAGLPEAFYRDWLQVALGRGLPLHAAARAPADAGFRLRRLPGPRRPVVHGRAHQGRPAGARGAGAAHAGGAGAGCFTGGQDQAGVDWRSSGGRDSGHHPAG